MNNAPFQSLKAAQNYIELVWRRTENELEPKKKSRKSRWKNLKKRREAIARKYV